MVVAASHTPTASPAAASVTAAVSPLGPAPTTAASRRRSSMSSRLAHPGRCARVWWCSEASGGGHDLFAEDLEWRHPPDIRHAAVRDVEAERREPAKALERLVDACAVVADIEVEQDG